MCTHKTKICVQLVGAARRTGLEKNRIVEENMLHQLYSETQMPRHNDQAAYLEVRGRRRRAIYFPAMSYEQEQR
jgi:hypothetical protein